MKINKKIKKLKKILKQNLIYIYKDKDGNSKIYSYHRDYNEYYYLRCLYRKCNGTEKYKISIGAIEVITECNLEYANHSYAKEDLIKNKIKNNKIRTEYLEDNLDNQEIFFKYMLENQPTIGYYDISLILYEKYNINKIIYKLAQFNSYKKYLKKNINFIMTEKLN